jgi:glycosyltransferase involved in cell wall biosynthesis
MITFIIPTIGRDTLQRSIDSIQNQTNPDWNIIVVFDGIPSTLFISNPKITIIENKKEGKYKNSAGNVRNHGMQFVKTEWIAFLDDDDTIAPDYIQTFYNEIQTYPLVDVVIFRMKRDSDILPNIKTDDFYEGDVGISFALKSELFKSGFQFKPSSTEDFEFLDLLRKNGKIIMISPHVKYFVNGLPPTNSGNIEDIQGNRIIINAKETFVGSIKSDVNYYPFLFIGGVICYAIYAWGLPFYKFGYRKRKNHRK